MSLLAPWMLVAGVGAALGVVLLHLLTTRRPPPAVLPTARFVPESDVRAVARASRPTDLLLLALRALAVLLVGAAFARPVADAPGPRVRSVYALDLSRAVADTAAARALVARRGAAGDTVIAFGRGAAAGALSPMFVSARRAAAGIARGADSVRLIVVSPVAGGAVDAASVTLRDTWPGRIELERVDGVADTARSSRPAMVSPLADDPLAPALDRLPPQRGVHAVRVVRGTPSAGDSTWVRAGDRVLVEWPAVIAGEPAPAGVATVGPRAATLVAPLIRGALPAPARDSGNHAPRTRVLARWNDGAPAALETPLGAGCVRTVSIGVPLAGDLTLRAPFVQVLETLVEPCGGARRPVLADSAIGWLVADGPLATGRAFDQLSPTQNRLPLVLLIAALALLAAESGLRRRTVGQEAA